MNQFDTIKKKVGTIRIRTWVLTASVLIALALYYVVNIGLDYTTMNVADFIFVGSIQIIVHCIYFPDGELFGTKDETFISNRTAYNQKADKINTGKTISKLREYCGIEYRERLNKYIENECLSIGITVDEMQILTKKFNGNWKENDNVDVGGKVIYLSKKKIKVLNTLLKERHKIEPNSPEMIMSAIETNGNLAIHDKSKTFAVFAFSRKVLTAILCGLLLSYITYTAKDGFGIADVAKATMCLFSAVTTAVMSYSSGETCVKVYKNQFYVQLNNFIDRFFDWLN